MVRAIAVILVLIVCAGAAGAARVLLDDGSYIHGEVLRVSGTKTLIQTSGPDGTGLVWIESAKIKGTQPEPPGTADALATIEELIGRGQLTDALERLDLLMRREPAHVDVTLFYARTLRKAWKFRASLFLYEQLIAGSSSPQLDVLQEAAETAVLASLEKEADVAIKRFKSAAKQNRDLQKYADALRTQLKGGARVVIPNPSSDAKSREELAEDRAKYESDDGDCYLSALVAARLLGALKSAYSTIPIRVQVTALVQDSVRDEYRKGGDEAAFIAAVKRVRLLVSVDDEAWITMYDWRKHSFLLQCLFTVAATYTAAAVDLTILRGKPDPRVVQTKELATANIASDQQTKMTLMTPRNRDLARDAQLREYERQRTELEEKMK
ncbi:MAG: hypothetical protein L6Q71_03025 [Planctomycetes bacterium]|nr:hypothetical protein [Planctomycetota bacterium]NUQ35270.1 hypothetical protein [Planctomycetaceae bacterium]